MHSKKKRQKTKHTAPASDTRPLSQAEIWDDSALIRSWNDALAEYEYYHSIHARGEDVEEILRRAEASELEDNDDDDEQQQQTRAPRKSGQSEGDVPVADMDMDGTNGRVGAVNGVETRLGGVDGDGDGEDDAEEGEVVEEAEPSVTDVAVGVGVGVGVDVTAPMIGPGLPPGDPNLTSKANAPMEKGPPHPLPPPALDQTLENIKMAYYWAGYYSGLYDGQRQAQGQAQSQSQSQPQHQHQHQHQHQSQ